jgi:hypothetical protein
LLDWDRDEAEELRPDCCEDMDADPDTEGRGEVGSDSPG